MRQLGENEMKPNCRMPQNVRLSEWLGRAFLVFKIVKPGDKFFCLANGEHERLYSIGYTQSTGVFSAA
jgi:hypothetical protein